MPDITTFIRNWIKRIKYHDNLNTIQEVVELGLCADLATILWEKYPNTTVHSNDHCIHTWIESNGKHYDMQNPKGVKNWKKLRYFKDCKTCSK